MPCPHDLQQHCPLLPCMVPPSATHITIRLVHFLPGSSRFEQAKGGGGGLIVMLGLQHEQERLFFMHT